ncbi:hypothetical protein HK102_000888 [Quaeritorhiza haematococci]|nr:hypothetical protein HK102_000888 [Quaeritorhiza haematococci]
MCDITLITAHLRELSSNMQQSVLVVGAGCFGLSAAVTLRSRGYDVTVFDRAEVPAVDGTVLATLTPRFLLDHLMTPKTNATSAFPASSTDINKIVRPDYGNDVIYQTIGLQAIERWHEWNADISRRSPTVSTLYHECGVLFLTSKQNFGTPESDSVRNLIAAGQEPSISVVRNENDRAELQKKFPGLRQALKVFPGGYVNRRAGWAESGNAVAYLAQRARELGVKFVTGAKQGAFAAFISDGTAAGRVEGIVTRDGKRHLGDKVLVATGAWSAAVVPELRGLITATGQPVVHFRIPEELKRKYSTANVPVWAADITKTGFYGFPPNADGIMKIANHGPGVSVLEYRRFFQKAFPEFNKMNITSTRICWYCDSFDGNFFICPIPTRQNLFVATGGSGHGFKFTPVIGDIIADVLEDKTTTSPYRDAIALFSWRTPHQLSGGESGGNEGGNGVGGSDAIDVLRAASVSEDGHGSRKPRVLTDFPMATIDDLTAEAFASGRLEQRVELDGRNARL